VLAHARRRIVHFNISEHPTAQWTAQQMSEAFPWEDVPRYLTRDRDHVYGPAFKDRVEHMGIAEVLTPPRSRWQNPFAERVIGSIRLRMSRPRHRLQRAPPSPAAQRLVPAEYPVCGTRGAGRNLKNASTW
jgi:hypothetical protein